jgi:hypothetical protein
MIDYTKEIERLELTQPKAAPESIHAASDVPLGQAIPAVMDAAQLAKARRGVSWTMLISVVFLAWFAWNARRGVWDGYYLQPFHAMFVLFPLVMACAVLWTLAFILRKMQQPENLANTGKELRQKMRWVSPVIALLMLGSFTSMLWAPRGIPVGRWLGLPAPSEPAVVSEAAADATEVTGTAASVAGLSAEQPSAEQPNMAAAAIASADDYPELLRAVDHNDLPTIRALAAAKQDMNVRNVNGYTGLHLAAARGAVPILQALIVSGADVNATADGEQGMGRTPLDSALFEDQVDAVKLLIAGGAKLDAADQTGWQALHYAAHHRATRSMPLLIAVAKQQKLSIDVRAMGRRGETPLMKAAEMNHLEGIRLLVQAGASVDMLDKYGKNALDYAEFFKKPEASDLLCSLGAKPTPLDPSAPNRETTKRSAC